MAATKSFRDLDAWRVSMDLTVLAYARAKQLPATELFELSAQMRRAAVSVPSNVAEGQATGRNGRYLYHVRIALGSLGELATQVEVAKRLKLVSPEATMEVEQQLERVGRLLHGLARSIRYTQAITATAWLTLLVALAFGQRLLPALGEVRLVGRCHDVFALAFAALDLVLTWIHVDVLAHLTSLVAR
jgi:four helix bundle protein